MSSAGQERSVRALHTAIPGRARFHVPGLKGSRTLKIYLESALSAKRLIKAVSASTATGNMLVLFDRQASLCAVAEAIDELLRKETPRRGELLRPSPVLAWQHMDIARVFRRLRTSMQGLSPEIFQSRFKKYGPNAVPRLRARSRWEILTGQFQSLPVALLVGAAVLSVLTGGTVDAIAVLCVVALNAGIGYATENYSEQTIASLFESGDHAVPVVRSGKREVIPLESVVPGDLLDLRPGVVIAADARVISAHGLALNESSLTGESAPVAKMPQPLSSDLALADRCNMVYRGTIVTGGSGLAVAVATGLETEAGRIQALVGMTKPPETPLQRELRKLGGKLVWVAGGACGLVFLAGLLRGYGVFRMVKNSIALAVAAVPEGLPALATTTLALAIRRMRQHHVIVRRLEAIETLASLSVICLDKTGTLTLNKMTVAEVDCAGVRYQVSDGGIVDGNGQRADPARYPGLERLAKIAALCNETILGRNHTGVELTGSPTENALIELALALGLDVADLRSRFPLRRVVYRSEGRLFMVTLHKAGDNHALAAVKGSPEEVLALCDEIERGSERDVMREEDRSTIAGANLRMTASGHRVLGFAYAYLPDETLPGDGVPRGLTWVGLAGMVDPLRPGVKELMRLLRNAGISPVMITGDQRGTAAAVARSLDLANGDALRIVDSSELESFEQVSSLEKVLQVFTRVTPAQKLQIVRLFQRAGLTVAMTGDGINDSPALKAADIGIAMGRSGTQAAREVAHIILEDDNLMSLIPAIEQGRITHVNIKKAVDFILSTNLSEILVMLAASAAGLGEPLSPAQLLWINLISDVFPALALGLDPPASELMSVPPHERTAEIAGNRDFVHLGQQSALISAGALGAYCYGLFKHGQSDAARTMCFGSLITAQLLHALTSRSREHRAFSRALPPSRILSAVLGISFAMQSAAMFFGPIRRLLGVTPVGIGDTFAALIAGVLPFLANEALKMPKAGPDLDPHAKVSPTPRCGSNFYDGLPEPL